ncbi:MAG: hypothetical protein ACOVQM_22370 [Pirellula sp.]|jgi:hypothetical protein
MNPSVFGSLGANADTTIVKLGDERHPLAGTCCHVGFDRMIGLHHYRPEVSACVRIPTDTESFAPLTDPIARSFTMLD